MENRIENIVDGIFIIFLVIFMYAILFKYFKIVVIIVIIYIIFQTYTLRKPTIILPNLSTNYITSPSFGTVIEINTNKNSIEIVIFLSLTDIHYQYIPVNGIVTNQYYKDGQFNPAYLMKKSLLNERLETTINSKYGNIIVYQVAGLLARRIKTNMRINQIVVRGQQLGFIYFGSQVRIILPKVKVFVCVGQSLKGPETVIAKF